MSGSKMWLIAVAFLAGTFITPFVLLLTTGNGDPTPVPPRSVLSPAPGWGDAAVRPEAALPTSPEPKSSVVAPSSVVVGATAVATRQPATPQATSTPSSEALVEIPALSGRFRITDTITSGNGAGTVVSFDITLQQTGSLVSGGNNDLSVSGRMDSGMLIAQFVQPALGYSGTFRWRLDASGGVGEFASSVPNSGTSRLVKL